MTKLFGRTYQIAIVVAFALPIMAPWVYIFFENSPRSEFLEKRQTLSAAVEQRITHELSLLKTYESVRAWVRYHLLHLTPSKYFILANDGWFFRNHGNLRSKRGVVKIPSLLRDHMGQERCSEAELKRWARVLNQRYYYLKRRGIKYVFTVAPRKSEIYPEAFNAHMRRRFRKTRAQQLLSYLMKHTEVPIVDLRSYLKKIRRHRPDGPALYFKTDGHWNMLGAYWAYHGIMGKLRKLTKTAIKPVPLSSFRIKWLNNWYHKRFTKLTGLLINEPYPFLLPIRNNPLKNVHVVKRQDKYFQSPARKLDSPWSERNLLVKRGIGRVGYPTQKLVNSHGVERSYVTIKNSGKAPLNTILVMGDSFGKRLLYFLSAHAKQTFRYREIHGFNPHLLSVPSIKRGKIDVVIQEMAQGAIGRRLPSNPQALKFGMS